MGVCSNEPECVAFASSRNLRGVDPSRGDPVHNFLIFLRKPSSVRTECEYRFRLQTDKRRDPKREHTHTHTQRQFELYIVD